MMRSRKRIFVRWACQLASSVYKRFSSSSSWSVRKWWPWYCAPIIINILVIIITSLVSKTLEWPWYFSTICAPRHMLLDLSVGHYWSMMMKMMITRNTMMMRILMVMGAQLVLKHQGHHFLTDQADDDENLFFAELASPSEKDSISWSYHSKYEHYIWAAPLGHLSFPN